MNTPANPTPEPAMVLIEHYGHRADVVLNRPDKRNALIVPMMTQLRDAFLQLAQDDSVNAILVRGAGGYPNEKLRVRSLRPNASQKLIFPRRPNR